jgi:hypothetical protein
MAHQPASQSANSRLLEYITLSSALLQCFALQIIDEEAYEMQGIFYVFVLANMLLNNYYRGTRIHLWPMIIAFAIYSVALIFGMFLTVTYYSYFLMTLLSSVLIYIFGNPEYYTKFEPSGQYAVGCIDTSTKMGQNKVLIYYPTEKSLKLSMRTIDGLWMAIF